VAADLLLICLTINKIPALGKSLLSETEGYEMTDEDDLKLIHQIIAGSGRKYTAGNIDRRKYDRLVDLGWLTSFVTNVSDVEYQVTEKGRTAAIVE
jgi:hypothetical protein